MPDASVVFAVATVVEPSVEQPSSIGVDVVESLPLVLKEKETEEKNLDDEMNGAADTDPRIKKQAGAVSGSPAGADPEMRRAALM